jgi:DNA-binding CsgD family transcriptional regulator
MPKKSDDEWLPDQRGRFRRKVGWWVNESGKRKQYPFGFGTSIDQAKARLVRVREFWSHVEQKNGESPKQYFPPLHPDVQSERGEPVWNGESLWIAKQLAAGKVQIAVGRLDSDDGYFYALRVQRLASAYPCVVFVPEDSESHAIGADFIRRTAEHQIQEIKELAPNVLPEISENFHTALDAYIADTQKKDVDPTPEGPTLSSFGSHKIANATMLKRHQKDRPLSVLDDDGCQELLDYWRMRPMTTDKRIKPAHPMAKRYCENHVSELIRFFRWLHKSKFGWRKPEDFDELKTNVKDIQEERTSIAAYTKRTFYLPSELQVLNKHATPLERLLLLLGLNCGFKGAEQGTLLLDHLFLEGEHPNSRYLREVSKFECLPDEQFLLYSRNKSKVYGEFLLWPQTMDVIKWALKQRQSVITKYGLTHRNLLITKTGTLYYRLTDGGKNRSQIFGNKWKALFQRVKKSEPNFPYFPFSSLRKTASDLIRHAADGEVSATFLMHGKPVKEDDLIDLYTKRPFGKVFKALRQVQIDLQPMFDAAPEDLVEQPMQQYTPMNKRERIVELKKEGRNVTQIMDEVGVSRMTVLRTLEKLYFRTKKPKSQGKKTSSK